MPGAGPEGGTPRAVPLRPLRRLLGGAGFRIAAFFALVFLVAGLAFGGVLWWSSAGALDRRTDAAIRVETTSLLERWREAGQSGVAESIAERLAEDVEDQTLYLLTDRGGRRLAGNLDAPAGGVLDPAQRWQSLALLREGVRTEARIFQAELPDGSRLVVGRDVEDKLRLRELLTEGLAWAAAAALLLAVAGAWMVRRALEARLQPAAETAAAIARGDLSQRVPLSGREDEFDRLSLTMNAMLDHIATLMEGVRGVSDAIAHDLRTPIARARAKLEEAVEEADAGRADQETLRQALEQGIADLDGITRVFQAVLRIAEVEAGARRAAFAPFDLAPVLEDAAELYGASAEARGQVLATEILPDAALDGLPLVGDRDLLLQAVANLLDNAVKFTQPGGRVELSAHAGVGRRGRVVRVEVADDGPGLSPAERGRAGERFFRADGARATPGSGLGLSLVRAVAALHEGEVLLTDAHPGADPPGLRVTVILPLARSASAAAPAHAVATAA